MHNVSPNGVELLEWAVATATTTHARVDALNALALALRDIDPQRGLAVGEQAYAQASSSYSLDKPNHSATATSLLTIALICERLGYLERALAAAHEALAFFETSGDTAQQTGAVRVIGNAHLAQANYPEALACYRRALGLVRAAGDQLSEAAVLSTIGQVYNYLGEHQQAIDAYHEAVAVYCQMYAPAAEALTYNNLAMAGRAASHLALAEAYKQAGDFQQALAHHEQALAAERHLHNQHGQPLRALHTTQMLQQEPTLLQERSDTLEREVLERRHAEQALQEANQQLQARIDELATLNQITRLVADQNDLAATLAVVAEQITKLLNASGAVVALLNDTQTELTFVADYDCDPHARNFVGTTIAFDDINFAPLARELHQPIVLSQPVINDLLRLFDDQPRLERYTSVLVVPLVMRGSVIGGLIVTSDQAERLFSEAEARWAETVAGQLAGLIDQARLLDQAVRAREVAEQASRTKSQFLATMSHELRTPLSSILGYTQLLRLDSRLPAEQVEILGFVEQSGNHLLNLINDLLDLAKIEAGKLELFESLNSLPLIIENVSAVAQERAGQKNIDFVVETQPPALLQQRTLLVYVDTRRLQQILLNLLSNAVKFTDSGYVQLRIAIVPNGAHPQSRLRVRFLVQDTGVGIAPHDLAQIFTPFFQTGDEYRRATGTGLGLAICAELVRLFGSTLHAESTPGVGSTFWFDLDLRTDVEQISASVC